VIITFSKHHVETLLSIIESYFPFLKNSLSANLEKQKNMLWHKDTAKDLESVIKIFIYFDRLNQL
jgi:hypothetical protein